MLPADIKLHKKTAVLELKYADGDRYELSAEFLRVHSPSAEVRGHGPGQEVLQVEKADVKIDHIEPVGNYALKFHFDDGHDTGLYTWEYLYELCLNKERLWHDYLERLRQAGARREKLPEGTQVLTFEPLKPK